MSTSGMYCSDSVEEKCSNDSANCHASTSRGLSGSNGNCEESYSYCSDGWSHCSEQIYHAETCSRPIFIADSSTRLHKSKWDVIKSCFKRYIKLKKTECPKTNRKHPQKYMENEESNDCVQLELEEKQSSVVTGKK